MSSGKVFLIGAGPGDPELLTLKAVRALAAAAVVLIDDLVDRRVLEFAPRARVIAVGKRGGCKSTPQEFIERLMVRLARRGSIVARVKGGDPFMFGRGGEEMLALRRAGVEYEVVSGITSGMAATAALGIPVSHRGLAPGAVFVTGHSGTSVQPDWALLAQSHMTLVIYMGISQLPRIVAALREGGLAAETPAAAIQNGTLDGQKSVVATLSTLPRAVSQAGLASPAIVVIGEVVNLAAVAREAEFRRQVA